MKDVTQLLRSPGDAGVDPKIRREQMGHATDAMTDRYTHVIAALTWRRPRPSPG
jgi:integrase